MNDINELRGNEEKKRLLRKYLHQWRTTYQKDFYSAMRLLLPQLDKTRYFLKESKLSRAYREVLGLSMSSEDGHHLEKWKLPSKSNTKSTGDFAMIVYETVFPRSTVTTPTKTVEDVNQLLDELGRIENTSTHANQVAIFRRVVDAYTPMEQRWLVRIILRDLKIGLSDNSIFDVYHPDARDMYSVSSNLKFVCDSLMDESKRIRDMPIKLFQSFKPQLGTRGMASMMESVKHNGVFYIEEKIDGERIQMHYDQSQQLFKWYSRKAKDYTYLYGDRPSETPKLASFVANCLDARNLILDGEMVAYDPNLDMVLPFGTLKSSARNQDATGPRPCFMVFDIVFCNDTPLPDYPLRERLQLLKKVVKENHGYLHLLPREEKSTEADVLQALGDMVQKRMEGIVLKDPSSRYEPGQRNKSWVKIKPEYYGTLGENCDLLVVGGKYGTGRRSNQLAQFICAVRDNRVRDSVKFTSFSMIGTGYTMDQIKEFNTLLRDIQTYNPQRLPDWFDHPEKSTERPDVLVNDFRDGIVIEVKAAQIVFSQMWSAGCTLRFPRFIKFRHDKTWEDVMTFTDVYKTRKDSDSKRSEIASKTDWLESNKKRPRLQVAKRASSSHSIISTQQGADTENILTKTHLFALLVFYVINGEDGVVEKSALEMLIKEQGGEFVQSDVTAKYVIAGKQNIRANSIINKGKRDVIKPQWVLDCVEAKEILPLMPKYMLYTSSQTKGEFLTKMDKYNDSYTQDATQDSLEDIWAGIPSACNQKTLRSVQRKYFDSIPIPGMFFLGMTLYFDTEWATAPTTPAERVAYTNDLDTIRRLKTSVIFYGGSLTSDLDDPRLSHIVLIDNQFERAKTLMASLCPQAQPHVPYIVSSLWVKRCVDNHTVVDELEFDARVPTKYLAATT
ncbi:ATP-dependent DNA ligase [Hesseltinella vesiculosa]|uniref:DNA ligase 4 n=1 Tax=Hesseltinella vesiculosa TaxID=101127 RepID=A0A1X2GRN1_9FUNG|nr:ATP-dependent DNA ligase [Hesseltinella vesiculosa]